MADVTPHDLLDQIIDTCSDSEIVSAYSVYTVDFDILSLRVNLVDQTFIDVFYNVSTNKTAFALIVAGERIYGKDNAKMGWHVHPIEDPNTHVPCASVSFKDFLAEVEDLHFSS